MLWAFNNTIRDVSPLSSLTGLMDLRLENNSSISDMRPLSGLTRLETLFLGSTAISDVTPVSGLTLLKVLNLFGAQVSNIRPLVANAGLGAGDTIDLTLNNLAQANCPDLKTLVNRGATVMFSPQKSGALTCP